MPTPLNEILSDRGTPITPENINPSEVSVLQNDITVQTPFQQLAALRDNLEHHIKSLRQRLISPQESNRSEVINVAIGNLERLQKSVNDMIESRPVDRVIQGNIVPALSGTQNVTETVTTGIGRVPGLSQLFLLTGVAGVASWLFGGIIRTGRRIFTGRWTQPTTPQANSANRTN